MYLFWLICWFVDLFICWGVYRFRGLGWLDFNHLPWVICGWFLFSRHLPQDRESILQWILKMSSALCPSWTIYQAKPYPNKLADGWDHCKLQPVVAKNNPTALEGLCRGCACDDASQRSPRQARQDGAENEPRSKKIGWRDRKIEEKKEKSELKKSFGWVVWVIIKVAAGVGCRGLVVGVGCL